MRRKASPKKNLFQFTAAPPCVSNSAQSAFLAARGVLRGPAFRLPRRFPASGSSLRGLPPRLPPRVRPRPLSVPVLYTYRRFAPESPTPPPPPSRFPPLAPGAPPPTSTPSHTSACLCCDIRSPPRELSPFFYVSVLGCTPPVCPREISGTRKWGT